jgi:hypothetical protein
VAWAPVSELGEETPGATLMSFREAVLSADVAEYFKETGRYATKAQLATLRDRLLGKDAVDDGGVDSALGGDENDPVQRSLYKTRAEKPAAFWIKTERRGHGWVVTSAGRDGSWDPTLLAEYLRLSDSLTGFGPHGKPVIYLYPTREETVTVRLGYRGRLTSTSPQIDPTLRGWSVRARPDGAIVDGQGRSWPYLVWEGVGPSHFDMTRGFVVAGTETDSFLCTSLARLGLDATESAEFRRYWVPKMRGNRYNLVHFDGPAYERLAPMSVDPSPDTMLRVFMVYRPLEAPAAVRPQLLWAPTRAGFTLVEWGGTRLGP